VAIYECHEVMLSEIVGAAMGEGRGCSWRFWADWIGWIGKRWCAADWWGEEKAKLFLDEMEIVFMHADGGVKRWIAGAGAG